MRKGKTKKNEEKNNSQKQMEIWNDKKIELFVPPKIIACKRGKSSLKRKI